MAAPLTFSEFLGWLDITGPTVPPGSRLILASDLLRYENFLVALRDRINAHELTLLDNTPDIATLITDLNTAEALLVTAGTDIDTLQADLDTAEANIAALTRGVSVNSGSVTMLKANKYYVHTGGAATLTLPVIAGNTGVEFIVKNRGSGTLTVTAETNKMYFTSVITSTGLAAGSYVSLVNDGTYWVRVI